MKFRNPETGEVFEDIVAARFNFCNQRCRECPISCWNNEGEMRCDIYCHFHPKEVVRLIGYEVVEDTPTDTPTNQLDSSTKVVGIDPVKPLEIEEVKYLESEAMKEDTPMSTKIRPAIEKLAEMEKQDANRKFPLFHSMHEGYAVLLEEVEEAREALTRTEISLSALWAHIRDNNAGRAPEFAGRIREHALDLATEAVQAAAMAQKFIDSADKKHPKNA